MPGSSVHGISQARILEGLAPHPPLEDLLDPGSKPTSPELAGGDRFYKVLWLNTLKKKKERQPRLDLGFLTSVLE